MTTVGTRGKDSLPFLFSFYLKISEHEVSSICQLLACASPNVEVILTGAILQWGDLTLLKFLIDNIFILFGGQVFHQTIGIQMGTICAPLFADLFLHAYDADFLQGLSRIKIEN